MKKLLFCLTMLAGLNAFALEVGDDAPCVELVNIQADGAESEYCIRQPNVEGQLKVLEFFSVTCSACIKNLPNLTALHNEFGDKVTFRMVSIDRVAQDIRDFVSAKADLINFDVAMDTNRDAKKAYNIFATPTLYVLDSNDVVVYKHVGVLKAKDLKDLKELFNK
jgi:thiol-disulfide isomerase/thioredoxin